MEFWNINCQIKQCKQITKIIARFLIFDYDN